MTESKKTSLLHLSSISLDILSIEYVEWNQRIQSSGKTVTRIRTKSNIFVLESDCQNYEDDVELLRNALKN